MQVTKVKEKIIKGKDRLLQEHKVCVATFVLLFFVWWAISLYMGYAPFGSNSLLMNDATHQYYPLLSQYRDRLLSGDGILYSTGGGLGFNFYTLWTYYLSSPFNVIAIFFPASQMDSFMDILIVLKIVLAGTTFAWYLERKKNKDNYSILPFACGYAFSTFMLGYSFNIMWLDCFAVFPIVLAALEDLMQKGKWKLYTISLAFCLWCNFYISFMICCFLVLWFLVYQHKTILLFLKRGILFVCASLLGAGVASVVLLPAYIGIVQTSAEDNIPEFGWKTMFSEILAGEEGGIFVFSDPISVNKNEYLANLYAGIFLLGLVILFFWVKEISLLQKVKVAAVMILLALSTNENVLNYVWHGLHQQVGIPNRFIFLLLFMMLLIGFYAFQYLQTIDSWKIVISGVIPAMLCAVLFYLERKNVTVTMLVFTMIFIVGYTVLELFYARKYKVEKLRKILLFVMCLELIVNAFVGSEHQGGVQVSNFYRNPSEVQKVADLLSEESYRTELANPTVYNEGMAYNLHGTSIFSSMTNQDTIRLLHALGYSTSSNAYNIAGGTPVLNTLFGVKNYILIGNDANRLDVGYEKTIERDGVTVYTKENVLPIAYLCEADVENWESLDDDFFANQNEVLRLMTGKEYQVYTETSYDLVETNDITVQTLDERQQFAYLSAEGKRDDHVVFETTIEEPQDLYLRIQAKYADKVSVFINGEIKAYKDLSSHFYHVGELDEGDVVTVAIGIEENSPTYGKISMSMYAYHDEVMQKAYADLNEGALQITQWQEGHIKGKVKVTNSKKTLFTTIPYEKGWSVLVDGKKQETETIEGGFLKVSLEEGEHDIEFVYEVPGLKIGAIVSLGSILVILLIAMLQKKKHIGQKLEEGEKKQNGKEREETDEWESQISKDVLQLVEHTACGYDHQPDINSIQSDED